MFLHIENQSLLWNSLQKSPYIVEFQQKYAAHRENWFRGIIEQFYMQWIGQRQPVPNTAKDLLEMNKQALQFMVQDLKRLLGYSSSAMESHKNNGASIPLMSYDVAAEKKQREDKWSSEFSQYQAEYNRLLASPVVPRSVLPSETTDERITNMDALLAEHTKRREYDLSSIAASFPPPLSNGPLTYKDDKDANNSSPVNVATTPFWEQTPLSVRPSAGSSQPMQAPRLKILEEIHPQVTKTVTWSEQLESVNAESYEYSV